MRRMQNRRISRVRQPCDDLLFVISTGCITYPRTDRSIVMPSTFQVLVAHGPSLLRFVETQDGEGKVSKEAVLLSPEPIQQTGLSDVGRTGLDLCVSPC